MEDAVPSYQWFVRSRGRDLRIYGATASSYTVRGADRGRAIGVEVSFFDDNNFFETVASNVTTTVTPCLPTP